MIVYNVSIFDEDEVPTHTLFVDKDEATKFYLNYLRYLIKEHNKDAERLGLQKVKLPKLKTLSDGANFLDSLSRPLVSGNVMLFEKIVNDQEHQENWVKKFLDNSL